MVNTITWTGPLLAPTITSLTKVDHGGSIPSGTYYVQMIAMDKDGWNLTNETTIRTSPKSSSWFSSTVDCDGADDSIQVSFSQVHGAFYYIFFYRKEVSDGTATMTKANKLVDSNASFETDGVAVNDYISNDTDATNTTVVSVDSETQLTIASDIFTNGEDYTIIETWKDAQRAASSTPTAADERCDGTATSQITDKLVDSNADFITDGVIADDIVYNSTDGTWANVVSVDDLRTLTLDADIFDTGNEAYVIYKKSSTYDITVSPTNRASVYTSPVTIWCNPGEDVPSNLCSQCGTGYVSITGSGEVDSGTATSTQTDKLIDSGQNFETTVEVGDIVEDTSGDTPVPFATVERVNSDTMLTLDTDIITSGDTYSIIRPITLEEIETEVGDDTLCFLKGQQFALMGAIDATGVTGPSRLSFDNGSIWVFGNYLGDDDMHITIGQADGCYGASIFTGAYGALWKTYENDNYYYCSFFSSTRSFGVANNGSEQMIEMRGSNFVGCLISVPNCDLYEGTTKDPEIEYCTFMGGYKIIQPKSDITLEVVKLLDEGGIQVYNQDVILKKFEFLGEYENYDLRIVTLSNSDTKTVTFVNGYNERTDRENNIPLVKWFNAVNPVRSGTADSGTTGTTLIDFEAFGSVNVGDTVYNVTDTPAGTNPTKVATKVDNSEITLEEDIDLDNGDSYEIYTDHERTVYNKYTMDVHIIDVDENDLESATVTLTDTNDNEIFSVSTDANGVITQQTVLSSTQVNSYVARDNKYNVSTTTTEKNPFTLVISKTGYETYSTKLDLYNVFNQTITIKQQTKGGTVLDLSTGKTLRKINPTNYGNTRWFVESK